MRLATVEQSREIDRLTQEEYKISGELLMETAGSAAAHEIDQAFYPELKGGAIGVVCGPGNNGGDGLVMARHLHSMGHRDIIVFAMAPKGARSELFDRQLERVDLQGLRVVHLSEEKEKWEQLRSCRLLVDALFGHGLTRDIEDSFRELIDLVNACQVPIVSLDVPSGLDCDRGHVRGTAIRAKMTLTFGIAKPGFFTSEGPLHVGRLRVLPIGFPFEVLRRVATTRFGFNERLARRYLPKRGDRSNKSDHGHLLAIAGSPGTWGAAGLCAVSAFRVGSGYVSLASFEDPKEIVSQHPEVMTGSLEDIWEEKKWSAVAIGPGLGVGDKTADVIRRLKEEKVEKVVLDADALTTCVQYDLFPLPASWVITPHSGELSRLIKVEVREIESDRFFYAQKAANELGCHVLLKGYRSVLAYEDRCMVIMAGNSALAKAGTGDVLTGMIGGLLAQGLPTLQATAAAAYIHGRMADEWVRVGNDKRTLLASDLSDHLPNLMGRLAGGALV